MTIVFDVHIRVMKNLQKHNIQRQHNVGPYNTYDKPLYTYVIYSNMEYVAICINSYRSPDVEVHCGTKCLQSSILDS